MVKYREKETTKEKKMNRLFDTSINVGLRQFYILGIAGSVGNLTGFLGNAYIYGFSIPTIFCALCTIIIFMASIWGINTRHVRKASYIIILLLTFIEFPILYYIYQTGTIAYMVLSMVAIATFLPTWEAVAFGGAAFLVDMSAVMLAYFHPMELEKVTGRDALYTTICSLMVVLFSVFIITILLNVQQRKQKEELKELSDKLKFAADHDVLTGLYNRRYLNQYLESLKGKEYYAVLMDLDFFKQINDSYGHGFGDKTLAAFSDILQKNITESGIAVRFGGEEFMLILPKYSKAQIEEMLEKVRTEYKLFGKVKKGREFTFSCGVEQYVNGMEVTELYRLADEKLYQAKENGRDCVFF